MDDVSDGSAITPVRLGIDARLARHDRVVDLLGPLLPHRNPPQWVHRAHGLRVAEGYARRASTLFELTDDLAACDVAVLPVGWEQVLLEPALAAATRSFCDDAARHGKTVLVFVDGDDHVPSPALNAVVLRTSLDRSPEARRTWPSPRGSPTRDSRALATTATVPRSASAARRTPWTSRIDGGPSTSSSTVASP